MEDADSGHRLVGQYTASKDQVDELAHGNGVEEEDILLGREKQARIADRETDYQKRRFNRGPLTPTRADPFAANTHANVNIRMSIGGKGISSCRGQRSAVESALLIVCLSVCDSGLLLTPKENILLFNPIAMGKLINLILGCGILADQTVSTVSILHFLIIAIDGN